MELIPTKRPLRYRISDWHQLPNCKSNTCSKVHITVSDFIQNCMLSGTRIMVNHDDFGPLFTYVVRAKGSMIRELSTNLVFSLTPEQILLELGKYGFDIVYTEYKHLQSSMIEYLMTLRKLEFDKIRILNTWHMKHGEKEFKWYVVAFKFKENQYWLNNDYCPPEKEFIEAMQNGTALNISAVSKDEHFDWSWLQGWVASIDDILQENM